eukprot:4753207-Lingulodinium_polyedra.AAC.1
MSFRKRSAAAAGFRFENKCTVSETAPRPWARWRFCRLNAPFQKRAIRFQNGTNTFQTSTAYRR